MSIFKRKKNWSNTLLIEGEKEAQIVARLEGLPMPNHDFDMYPVDLQLPKRCTFLESLKKAVKYSELNIYNIFCKVKN